MRHTERDAPDQRPNPTTRTPFVNWFVIAVAALVFFAVQPRNDPRDIAEFMHAHATIPCEIITAQPLNVREVSTGTCVRDSSPPAHPDKHVYLSLLTAVFLHGGIGHLLGNLWVLWIFGNNVRTSSVMCATPSSTSSPVSWPRWVTCWRTRRTPSP